jgi:RNA polymerase sigma-70 factor (ECF subfamily)
MPPEVAAEPNAFHAKHAALVAWLHAQSGAGRWQVTQEELAVALERSAAYCFDGAVPAGDPLETYLRGLHLEDLAFACALRRGSEAAWEEFVARYRPLLYAAARAIVTTAGEGRARELADSLYAELYGVRGTDGTERRPLLDYFHGRSKLATWLRTVLAQRHVDALRAGQRTAPLEEERATSDGAGKTHPLRSNRMPEVADPDRERLLPRLRQAVSAALGELAPADRILLSLYYVDDLTLAQIARIRKAHEATVSRHLERIRQELRHGVERKLAGGLPAGQRGLNGSGGGLSPAEVELCFSYAVEDWAFDLAGSLGASITGQET